MRLKAGRKSNNQDKESLNCDFLNNKKPWLNCKPRFSFFLARIDLYSRLFQSEGQLFLFQTARKIKHPDPSPIFLDQITGILHLLGQSGLDLIQNMNNR